MSGRTVHPVHIHSGLLPIGDLAAGAEDLSYLPVCVKLEQRCYLALLRRKDFAFCVVPGNNLLENAITVLEKPSPSSGICGWVK